MDDNGNNNNNHHHHDDHDHDHDHMPLSWLMRPHHLAPIGGGTW